MKYRIVGFFGDRATAETIIFGLPKPEVKSISEGSNFFVRYHVEMPLSENEDKLFYYDLPSTDDHSRLEVGTIDLLSSIHGKGETSRSKNHPSEKR